MIRALYTGPGVVREALPVALKESPRVLKQSRGQSGDGILRVAFPEVHDVLAQQISRHTALLVRHAKRGSIEERISHGAFLTRCLPYIAGSGAMFDQLYQLRLPKGMIRCYIAKDQVQGSTSNSSTPSTRHQVMTR